MEAVRQMEKENKSFLNLTANAHAFTVQFGRSWGMYEAVLAPLRRYHGLTNKTH
jgi:uncharacterized protein YifE (UPF0438 family)